MSGPSSLAAMRSLSAYDIVRLCEWGRNKHALDRALVLLRAAQPSAAPDSLARLPIGRRDALLLALRDRTFGSTFELHVRCPACAEPLEFTMTVAQLSVSPPAPAEEGGALRFDEVELRYRLPNSIDLAAVVEVVDVHEARERLFERCVEARGPDGVDVPIGTLPRAALDALEARFAEADPQADIRFRLSCEACGHRWSAPFDIVTFFWAELEAESLQLQREVHSIAKLYGWTEPYILGMGAVRRAQYLKLARADLD